MPLNLVERNNADGGRVKAYPRARTEMKTSKQSRSPGLFAGLGLILAYATLLAVLPDRRPAVRDVAQNLQTTLRSPRSKDEPARFNTSVPARPGRGRAQLIPAKSWKGSKTSLADCANPRRPPSCDFGWCRLLCASRLFPAITALVSLYGTCLVLDDPRQHGVPVDGDARCCSWYCR